MKLIVGTKRGLFQQFSMQCPLTSKLSNEKVQERQAT